MKIVSICSSVLNIVLDPQCRQAQCYFLMVVFNVTWQLKCVRQTEGGDVLSTTHRIIRTNIVIIQTQHFVWIKIVDTESENIGVVEQYTSGKALL
ncbi:hypothetical protein VCRA2113O140_30039 [Vibrio crassostreae]|nr:hypothetical protein VCRA2119O145_120047 [Vibrio crassostreae]CAK1851391.1 hypothetical protein VCRA2113O137_10040 [Vibrio crassostreae]CAK2058304.1 hypothetical protein VCRA2113O140_30039 [Vibrio crassostreae]CAK2087776.1 hypothetical protein VCRA2113O138_30270 [Vibrio crassostreae]CAK2332617.1 hypothetical protein VCRA2117O142_290046 [Vibrio crassostreae]